MTMQIPAESAPHHRAIDIRLIVALDDRLFREAITRALEGAPGLGVVGTAEDLPQTEVQIERTKPNVTVLGPFGHGHPTMTVARPLVEAAACRFVFVVERLTWTVVRQASDIGALGIVPVSASFGHLVTAIRGAASGYLTVGHDVLEPIESPTRDLTQREQLILRLTANGVPINDIAKKLFLSPGTVRNQTSSLIKKLGARNRHEAARLAAEQGLL